MLPEQYEPAGELLDRLTSFQYSKRLTFYNCTTCGSNMLAHCWSDGDDHSKGFQWDASCGTLEQADDVYEVQGHEHIADTLDGGFADFLPSINGTPVERWPHHFREGEQLPLYWQSADRPHNPPLPEDRLHAHCKCGGIDFWVARPSERSKSASSKWPDLIVPYHSDQPRPDPETWWLRDNDTKFLAGLCSCNSCRLDTGMEWIEWAFIPAADISLDKEGNEPFSLDFGTMKSYRSSEDVTRHHCGVCGATVFFFSEERPTLLDVAVGLLDAPEGSRAESWLEFRVQRLSFREDAIPRAESLTVGVEHGLEQFGKRHQR